MSYLVKSLQQHGGVSFEVNGNTVVLSPSGKPGDSITVLNLNESILAAQGLGYVSVTDLNPTPPGGDSGYHVFGSFLAPELVDPALGLIQLDSSLSRQMHFIQSLGGVSDVTASIQIPPGSHIGDELVLVGTSDEDVLVFAGDGRGINANGDLVIKKNRGRVYLFWDGFNWSDIARP